ncbi:sensor histidine kinase [Runella slithyformis]|nr:PAS domain S-box protein [Runella slithyformis]
MEGHVLCEFSVQTSRLEMQVVAMHDEYLLTLHRILSKKTSQKPQDALLYSAFLEYADVGITFMDTNAVIKVVNPAFEKMTGYRAEELVDTVTAGSLRVPEILERQIQELLPQITKKDLEGEEIILVYLAEKGILKRENTLLRKDGTHLSVLSTVTEVYDDNGDCIGYLNFTFDITDLKQAQLRLDLANQRLKLATQAGKVGIWEYDILTDLYTWDEEVYKIHGVPPGTIVTHGYFLSLIHPEDRHYMNVDPENVCIGDFDVEPIRILGPDGKLRYVKCSGRRIFNETTGLTDVIGVVTDVTKNFLSQLALTESEKRYRFLVNNLKGVIFQTDLQGNWTFLNQYWTEITGFEVDKALGVYCLEFVHPEDRERNLAYILDLFGQKKEYCRHEVRYLHIDGGYRWIEAFAKLTFDEEGQPIGTIGTLYDISDRKKMQQIVADSEKRFKAIFNSTFQFMTLTDINGNLLEMNQAVLEGRGIVKEEALGKPFWEASPPEKHITPQHVLKEYFQEAAKGQAIRREIELLDRDYQPMVIDFSIKPLKDDSGKVHSLLTEGRVITEQKRAQAALLESEQRFREISEKVDEIFWIRSGDNQKFLYINPAFERITGHTCQSLYDDPLSFTSLVVEEDFPALIKLITAEQECEFPFRIQKEDGEIRWLMAHVFIVRDDKGIIQRRIGVTNDITPQKEKELLLTRSLEKEKELNMFKSHFVSHVSHEFRTPLAIVQSSIELLQHYLFNTKDIQLNPQYVPKIQHHFSLIENKIIFFTDLLTDLLTLQQIEIGKITFHPQPVDTVVFIIDLIHGFFNDRPDGRSVELRIEGVPRLVWMDEKLLTRVLINLLSNAFKFSKDNPLLRLIFQQDRLKIDITDNGIGIPAEDIPRLFSTFFRAGNVGSITGTGLGLQISKNLVEMHGGHIYVSSQQNKGTTMTIELPITLE